MMSSWDDLVYRIYHLRNHVLRLFGMEERTLQEIHQRRILSRVPPLPTDMADLHLPRMEKF